MNASLPAGWRWCRLGDIVREGPTNGYSGPTAPNACGTPTLRLSATTQGTLVLDESTTKRLVETIASESDLWLRPGDLLVQRSNTPDLVGTAAVFDGPSNAFVYPDLMMRLRLQDPTTTAWVWRYMNGPEGRRFFGTMAAGSSGSMPKISGAKLREMRIPIPPISEQRRIAAILDEADLLRRKRREALGLLDELLRSAFLEMFGDPVTNPRGWPTLRLDEVSDIASGVTKGRKLDGRQTVTVPYMRVANVQDGHIRMDDVKEVEVLPDDVERYRLQVGDVLLTEGGDPDKLGRGAVWYGQIDPCIHQNHIFRVRCDREKVLPEYVSRMLGSDLGKRYFARAAKQTTGIASINMTQLRGAPVLLAPIDCQHRWDDFVREHRREVERAEVRGREVDAMFSSLLHRAFTGAL
jgi:type I restriction enzyme S subunit